MDRYFEIQLGGTGGQGLVFISSFIAAAAMGDGMNVVQTQSYGIAQRGGYISAEVLISTEEILFQQVVRPDIIIALHDAVGNRFDDAAAPVIYDSGLINAPSGGQWHGLPFADMAGKLRAPKAANLIALGAALNFVPFVSLESIEKTARCLFKPQVADINIKAVRLGISGTAGHCAGGK